jgi:hypothetical protein
VGDSEDAVVARLEGLAVALDGEPDAAFREATRARLVAMAAVRSPAPAPPSRLRTLLSFRAADSTPVRLRSRLTAGLSGAALTVTALGALAAVATNAGPGDLLYGLKRGTEQTQLALASDSTRGQTLLDFASTRLSELTTLVDDDAAALPAAGAVTGSGTVAAGSSPELVLQTLHTMDAQTTAGAAWLDGRSVSSTDAAPLDVLAHWAAGQSTGLTALQSHLPAAASKAAVTSLDLLAGITTRTTGLRTALACPTGPAVSGTDALGPLPGTCRSTPGAPSASGGKGSATVPSRGAGTSGTQGIPGTQGTLPSGAGGSSTSGSGTSGSAGSGGGAPSTLPPVLPTPTLPSLPLPTSGAKITGPSGSALVPKVSTPSESSAPGLCLGPIKIGNC